MAENTEQEVTTQESTQQSEPTQEPEVQAPEQATKEVNPESVEMPSTQAPTATPAPEPVTPSTSAPPSAIVPPTPVVAPPVPVSFLARALEAIRFRKKAKLEKIMKLAQEKGSITNDQVEKLLHISDSTTQRYLNALVKDGRLRVVGLGNLRRYEPLGGSNGGN